MNAEPLRMLQTVHAFEKGLAGGQSIEEVCVALKISPRTVRRWLKRYAWPDDDEFDVLGSLETGKLQNGPAVLKGRRCGLIALLRHFTQPRYREGAILRLSDLHLKVGEIPHFRLDRQLVPVPRAKPLTAKQMEQLITPLLNHDQLQRLNDDPSADIDAAIEWPEERMSFRINVFRDREGLACTLRVLPREVPPLSEVGFPSDAIWKDVVRLRQGLVIVTGVSGCGKSTTIASLLKHVAQHRRARVITLEDPIEYIIESDHSVVSQREVGRHVHSFESGLRSALRENPDIIFVGEMRDREAAALALTAAETGHVVFSTMHTRDTVGAVTRILDMFPADRLHELETQLSMSLTYVLAQKLVPRADGKGRVVAMEVLRGIGAVAHVIRAGNLHQMYSVLETHRKEGLSTLENHLKRLVDEGVLKRRVALRYANEPAALEALLGDSKALPPGQA